MRAINAFFTNLSNRITAIVVKVRDAIAAFIADKPILADFAEGAQQVIGPVNRLTAGSWFAGALFGLGVGAMRGLGFGALMTGALVGALLGNMILLVWVIPAIIGSNDMTSRQIASVAMYVIGNLAAVHGFIAVAFYATLMYVLVKRAFDTGADQGAYRALKMVHNATTKGCGIWIDGFEFKAQTDHVNTESFIPVV